MASRIGIGIVTAALSLFAPAAWAQSALVAPDEVVIYLHASMENADFVEGLVCELGRGLRVPVQSTTIDLPFTRNDLATPTQLDVGKVVRLFGRAKAAEFSANDRVAMVDAGILKARPVGACNTVAMADR
jgi:hypothetical protein